MDLDRVDFEPLRVSGLLLRPWRTDDATEVLAAFQDSAIAMWNPADSDHPDMATARSWIEARSDWSRGDHLSLAVADAGTGDLMGSISLFKIDRLNANAEVGYWTVQRARGRGTATAALATIARFGFDELELHRVQLFHAVENTASCRVAIKAGFGCEGRLRESYRYADGRLHDEHLHGRLSGDDVPI